MSPNPQFDPARIQQLFEALRQRDQSIRDVGAALEEVAAVSPVQLIQQAPMYAQKLNNAALRFPSPAVQNIVRGTSDILKQLHSWQLRRKLNLMVRPTIPISVAWDNVPAGTLGAQATVSAPYTGQAFRVTDILCTAAAPFRFVFFNIGGVDFAEPSRDRVTYTGAVGVPVQANRGLDFPQLKARDLTNRVDGNWAPWTKVDFTSDATITLTPFNYGTVAGSVILTILCRSNPCGHQFRSSQLVPIAAQAQRNAIMGATYLESVDPSMLE